MLFLLLATLSVQADEVEELTYQLTVAGQPVGRRTVTVRYLQEENREVRLLESYTELSFAAGKDGVTFTQRLGGQGRSPAGTFNATTATDGEVSEVHAVRRSEGWTVTTVAPERLATEAYSHRDVDASSLTLIDPGAAGYLSGRTRLRVLAAETGEVLDGSK